MEATTKVWTFRVGNEYAACPVTRGRHPNKQSIEAGRRQVGKGKSKAAALAALAKILGQPVDSFTVSAL